MFPNKPLVTRPVRRFILVGLIIAFFILSPLVVLYTAGYRFDYKTFDMKQTGALSIDAMPDDLTVQLDGTRVEQDLPLRLPNVAPGSYQLILSKPGYKSWHKEIMIESGQTTYIKNVFLFKEQKPQEIILPQDEELIELFPSHDATNFLYITKKGFHYSVYTYSVLTQVTELVYLTGEVYPRVSWSPRAPYALIQIAQTKDTTRLVLFSPEKMRIAAFIDVPTPSRSLRYQWPMNQSLAAAYIQNKDAIQVLSFHGLEKTIGKTTSSIWFVDTREYIWFMQGNTLFERNKIGDAQRHLSFEEPIEKIISIDDNKFIVQTPNHTVVSTRDTSLFPHRALPTNSTIYSYPRKEWLAWSPWEFWTIHEQGAVFLANRFREPITAILPLDVEGLVLTITSTTLSTFNPGYYVEQELLRADAIEHVGTNPYKKSIYFLGTVAGKRGVYSLEFE